MLSAPTLYRQLVAPTTTPTARNSTRRSPLWVGSAGTVSRRLPLGSPRLRSPCGLAAVSSEGLTGDRSAPKLSWLSAAFRFLQFQALGALLLSRRPGAPPAAPLPPGSLPGVAHRWASWGVTGLCVLACVFLGLPCVCACARKTMSRSGGLFVGKRGRFCPS